VELFLVQNLPATRLTEEAKMSQMTATSDTDPKPAASRCDWSTASSNGRWPLERVLFTLAGVMTILSAVLAAVVSPWFLLLAGFVGLNQLAYAALGACPSSLIIARIFGVRPGVNARAEIN
jgi:hypothetical protein